MDKNDRKVESLMDKIDSSSFLLTFAIFSIHFEVGSYFKVERQHIAVPTFGNVTEANE